MHCIHLVDIRDYVTRIGNGARALLNAYSTKFNVPSVLRLLLFELAQQATGSFYKLMVVV